MDLDDWLAAGELVIAVVGIVIGLVRRPRLSSAPHYLQRGHVHEQDGLRRLLGALQQLRDAAVARVDVAAAGPREATPAADALIAAYERARHLAETTSADDIRLAALEAAQVMVGAEGSLAGTVPSPAETREAHEKIRRSFDGANRLIEARLRELNRLITRSR